MMDFLRIMETNADCYADRPFAQDQDNSLTYREFYELSGKVYAYLKKKKIGKEEFVLINLPRGVLMIAVACGVIRSGAAFVITEDSLPEERVDYIYKDSSSVLKIDESCLKEIIDEKPLQGFEPRDMHSAVFAVYTSGTTGSPKGVLHEYGNIERILRTNTRAKVKERFNLPEERFATDKETFALCAPMNFIFSHFCFLNCVVNATRMVVVSYGVLKDPKQFHEFLLDKKITFTFLSPSYVRTMEPLLRSLKLCLVGAEPVTDLYSDKLTIYNGYTMSEVGFTLGTYRIEHAFSNTPVREKEWIYPIRLIDENGNDVMPGEKGEILIENPYVRGYINLKEKTEAAFVNGWYHSGDLGKLDEEGRLLILGRLDDMAKINGNRVEPAEIETAARQMLGLSWAAVRILEDHGKNFICLYYLDKENVDAEIAKKKLSEKLPYYMLPAYFIPISEIPHTAAGKFNRKALPVPLKDSDRPPYRAPESELQITICKAFATVFHLEKAGLDEDFFKLGGDSLRAMELVTASSLENMSVSDVFQGKTPSGIAECYGQHLLMADVNELNEKAFGKDYPLTPNQEYTVKWQLKEPASTMRSIHSLLKFDKKVIDMTKMAEAINKAMRNHPALMSEIFYDETGNLRQRFNPEILKDTVIEKISDADFMHLKETLVEPFTMIGVPLFRARVFETETAGYVFIDVHHTVFDGSSNSILLKDIMAAYYGKPLDTDYYPYLLDNEGYLPGTPEYENHKNYFDSKYYGNDWCYHLSGEGEASKSEIGVVKMALDADDRQFSAKGVSKNAIFILAALIAMAKCESQKKIMLFWTFNGRTNRKESQSLGNLRCTLPIAVSFEDDLDIHKLLGEVNRQINEGIAHCRYAYLEANPSMLDEGVTRVLYQGKLNDRPNIPGFIETIPLVHESLVSRAFVNLEIYDVSDKEYLTLKYTGNCYSEEKIKEFITVYNQTLRKLLTD